MKEMKDSGTAWTGIIPSHWDVGRIDGFYSLRNTKVSDKDYPPLSVTMGGIIPQLETAAKTNAHDDRKLVRKGDFAINSRSDRRGSCGISSYDGSVSLINTILYPKRKMDPEYYDWLFHTVQFADEFYKWGHGIVDDLWTTNYQDMKKIKIPVPPIDEQHIIALYLNKQCNSINALSADIKSEIETLEAYKRSVITEAVTKGLNPHVEMKDSEIFYMAPYNKTWKLSKIGYECSKLQKSFSPEDKPLICTNKGKVILRPEDLTGKMVSEDNAMQGIHKGDIAIHGMDTWHGAIALSEHSGKITRVVHVCDSKQDKRFIVYYLQQLAFNGVYKLISNGVRGNTSDFRSWEKVKNIYIALPTIEEQAEISDYLDKICSETEMIITQKKELLDVLEQYKKSLIYEYVTGKKEVPAT